MVFFCEVNTVAVFEPGVVALTSLVHYQIAQGELKSMSLEVPEGMNVTSVRAPGLSTWRYDPETRKLEAILERPTSTDFTLEVMSQVACEGVPYDVDIGSLAVEDAGQTVRSGWLGSNKALVNFEVLYGHTAAGNVSYDNGSDIPRATGPEQARTGQDLHLSS